MAEGSEYAIEAVRNDGSVSTVFSIEWIAVGTESGFALLPATDGVVEKKAYGEGQNMPIPWLVARGAGKLSVVYLSQA
jgi:hypothetical protein